MANFPTAICRYCTIVTLLKYRFYLPRNESNLCSGGMDGRITGAPEFLLMPITIAIPTKQWQSSGGHTTIQLGGESGTFIKIQKGDLVIIPAGVAHKNMGHENDVVCIGGYPQGKDFDINTGEPGERSFTDTAIAAVPVPPNGPLSPATELYSFWSRYQQSLQSSALNNLSFKKT